MLQARHLARRVSACRVLGAARWLPHARRRPLNSLYVHVGGSIETEQRMRRPSRQSSRGTWSLAANVEPSRARCRLARPTRPRGLTSPGGGRKTQRAAPQQRAALVPERPLWPWRPSPLLLGRPRQPQPALGPRQAQATAATRRLPSPGPSGGSGPSTVRHFHGLRGRLLEARNALVACEWRGGGGGGGLAAPLVAVRTRSRARPKSPALALAPHLGARGGRPGAGAGWSRRGGGRRGCLHCAP